MTQITIIGAGMAGLLAANMLRRHDVTVIERQPSLPNNHHAVLRFRDTEVSRQLHIPFREVRVFKSCDEADPIRAAVQYSHKCLGRYEVRSLINLEPSTRYIAPGDLISQMARGVNIRYGVNGPWPEWNIISTIPMGALMDALAYDGPRPTFLSLPGLVIKAKVADCDMFATRYYAAPDVPWYRASVTGDELIIEFSGIELEDEMSIEQQAGLERTALTAIEAVARDFGFDPELVTSPSIHPTRYAKIARLSPDDRAKADAFMFWASTEHRIFSLGRFATWRPGLLMDDLVGDIIKIEGWMSSSQFAIRKSL